MVRQRRTRKPEHRVGVFRTSGTIDATISTAADGARMASKAEVKGDRTRFAINGVVFRVAWDVAEQRYLWTSECGRFTAGRNVGASHFWSRAGGELVERQAASLRVAMLHATMARRVAA